MKNIDILTKYISLYILQNRIKEYFYKFGTKGYIIWSKFYFIFSSDGINLNEIEFYIFFSCYSRPTHRLMYDIIYC